MSNWAIVAIPKKDDYVWRISSEKVPHMTILFLGDQPENRANDAIAEYLEHTIETSLTQFGMSVKKRGTLGPEDADVLFFDKYNLKRLEDFRSYLLQDQVIKSMYDSTEQYEGFTPHLTLGYPKTPAKVDDRDYPGINWINFDRVALWTGDYDGPTFELPTEDDLMELSMNEPRVAALAHYGVKGMQWGVRRSKVELAKKRTKDSEDYTRTRKLKANPKRTLSNKEMQTVIKRLEMEKKLKDLDPNVVGKGNKALKTTLGVVGSISALVAASNTPIAKAARTSAKTTAKKVKSKILG